MFYAGGRVKVYSEKLIQVFFLTNKKLEGVQKHSALFSAIQLPSEVARWLVTEKHKRSRL